MGGGTTATGEASVRLVVGRDGAVRRSRVIRSSGDEQVDQMFGTLGAHLQFSPQPNMDGSEMNATMLAGYSCGADQATSTVNVLGLEIPARAPVSPTP
jgi:TonB family protein